MKPVLICGGVGTKMWPLSRVKHPKHFLPLINGQSLYQINYNILLEKFRPEEIHILTTTDQVKTALAQAPGIPRKNCIIEPELRNHGPAMGLMAVKLSMIDPEEPFFLVQVDDLRQPGKEFLKMIERCEFLVNKKKKLITGGIRPDYLIFGVDYLLAEEKIKDVDGLEVYQMKKWLDRTTGKQEIEKYFKQRSLFAHANHYCWTPKLLLESYRHWAPDWYLTLQKIKAAIGNTNEEKIIKLEYSKMAKAQVEKVTSHELEEGYVVELPFKWIDFGTWESLARYYKSEGIAFGQEDLLEIDSQSYFVQQQTGKFVAIIGVKDLIVVDTKDGLLICDKNQTGRVGEVVEYLRGKQKKDYL